MDQLTSYPRLVKGKVTPVSLNKCIKDYEIINIILHEFGIIYTLDNDNIMKLNGSLLQKARLAYIREKKVRKHVTKSR